MLSRTRPLIVVMTGTLLLAGCMHAQPRPQSTARNGQAPLPPSLPAPAPPSWQPTVPEPPPIPARAETPAPPTPPITPSSPTSQPIASEIAPAAAAAPAEPANPFDKVRELHRLAAGQYAFIDAYTARLRRREVINGKDKPEEVMLFKFRKQPFSVYFKWIGSEGKGREVVYVQNRHEDKIHSLLAAGDFPFMPAGKRMSISPDNPMVLGRSRHRISESGIGHSIDEIGKVLEGPTGSLLFGVGLQSDAGLPVQTANRLRYRGQQRRPEFPAPLDVVERYIPPKEEIPLPGGGYRFFYFEPTSHLPLLIITQDGTGKEVEYYCYDQLQYPVSVGDNDFDPDKLWLKR